MKFDLCKEYRFAKGTLTSSKTGTLAIYTHLTNEQVVESSKSLNGLFSANAN